MAQDTLEAMIARFATARTQLLGELGKVIVGQREVIDQVFATMLAGGHCLLVGVPGLAKTLLVSTLARCCSVSFKRIQFTPDLMPSDITGTNVIEEADGGSRQFRFIHGPIFAHIILADEINRTPPKTQAALLEAMQERQVSIGDTSYPLPDPFFVIATQNPIEQEGTYPLPEAQQDRFMFTIEVDYPRLEEEEQILAATTAGARPSPAVVFDAETLLKMQRLIRQVPISPYVVKYCAALTRATRPADATAPEFIRKFVEYGAGPRAGQYLILGAKAIAAMQGRIHPSLADVRQVARPVLRHRLGCNFAAAAEGFDSIGLIERLLEHVPEPDVPKYQ
jgi:MoxR-like ATPase